MEYRTAGGGLSLLAMRAPRLYSTNGADWFYGNGINWNADFHAVCYGNEKFVAVGSYGNVGISPDGHHWTNINTGGFSEAGQTLFGVAYGNNVFVGITWYNTLISYDGLTWWEYYQTNLDTKLASIVYSNGRFFLLGNNLYSSTNGIQWTLVITNFSAGSFAYGNGIYVADHSYSQDGISWETKTAPFAPFFTSVAFGDGRFVASDKSGVGVSVSTNGIYWNYVDLAQHPFLNSVAYGNRLFVAVGMNGLIFQSAPLVNLNIAFDRTGVALSLCGAVGMSYRVDYADQAGPNASWTALKSVNPSSMPYSLSDSNSAQHIKRFYRAVLLP